MSDTDVALNACASLQMILEKRFGAQGRGLHEKVTHVESALDPDLVAKIRFIASVRNDVVHRRVPIENPERFEAVSKEAIELLSCGKLKSPEEAISLLSGRSGESATGSDPFLMPKRLVELNFIFALAMGLYGFVIGAIKGYREGGIGGAIVFGAMHAALVGFVAFHAWWIVLIGGFLYTLYLLWGVKL